MPHMNNLDLAVFPAMSKRHTTMLRESLKSCAKPDAIWNAARQVWNDLPSSSIARGFILAYRVAGKVIENNGGNKFLHDNSFHAGVRSDFYNTDTGVKPVVYKP